MPAPLIGLTLHPVTDPDRAELDLLLDNIIRCVERVGGLPVLIPLGLDEGTLLGLYARLDGVLFSGGGDIDPARYGAEWHPRIGGVDAERDRLELALARWVVADEKPFFGICRGSQILNVALGGTLYRDIGEHPGAQRHTFPYPEFPHALRPHEIKVEEDSLLADVLGEPMIAVNSLHHQANQDIAPGLRVVARAPDGIVEALEIPDHPFGLTVQWHPECLPDAPEMQRLFEAFVAAAGENARHRSKWRAQGNRVSGKIWDDYGYLRQVGGIPCPRLLSLPSKRTLPT
jgi:putative glutamine amidotransferase